MTKVDYNKVKDQLFHSNKTIQKNSKMWRARNRKKTTISKNSLSQKISTKAKSRQKYIRNVYKNLTPETTFKWFLKVLSKFHTQYSQEEYDEIIDKNIDVGMIVKKFLRFTNLSLASLILIEKDSYKK